MNRIGINNSMYGRHHSEETKVKLRIALTGRTFSEETKVKMSIAARARAGTASKETREKIGAISRTRRQDPEYQAKASATSREQWQDPAYRTKTTVARIRALHIRPNLAEVALQDILDRHFPGTWKYVGDGQLIIGKYIPDFMNVNGKKEVIELFGTYWHNLFDIAKRKEHYRQYGFRVAIIWEDELENEDRLIKVLGKKLIGLGVAT